MITPKIPLLKDGQILSVDVVNSIIKRTEYAGDLLKQYKLIAGTEMYVEPHYDGTRVSYLQPVGGGGTPVIFTINWETVQSGTISSGGWQITDNGNSIRFNIEDSVNCGGSNANIQRGIATATINVTGGIRIMTVSLSGLAERQSTGFESMKLALDGITIISSTSPGGNLGCLMGPVVVSTLVNGPYLIPAGIHTLVLSFSTVDALYHKGAFYLCQLTFA